MDKQITAYCVKCKKIRPMVRAKKIVKNINGRKVNFLIGYCKVCNTKMSRILASK